jgi:cyclophilin family peptidyl-prolyl cis-trans isomerase
MSFRRFNTLESLEARIAPANVFPTPVFPLPDVVAGPGQTGATVDLSKIFDTLATSPNRTILKISTSFDADPNTPGIQGDIFIELFDDAAPLTVQNFLAYAFNKNADGDYDGTFFHRLAEGFVLQGGGFQVDGDKYPHIDTLPEVHNEFSPLRSNLRGTIALAKTGAGPNTGTSEWFINLADNSQNLDNQNGGFTVFARVLDMPGLVDGMEVVDKITTLPTFEVLENTGFEAPVDGFTPAPGAKPTATNLIRITDIQVQPPSVGDTSGLSYQVVGVKKVEGGSATDVDSDVVSAALNGTSLNLTYAKNKAGIAEVTVRVAKPGEEPYDESFLVTVQPNLISHVIKDGLETAIIPGDSAKVKVEVFNTGGAIAEGPVEVQFFLIAYEKVSVGGQVQLRIVEPFTRVDLNSEAGAIKIGSGSSAELTAKVQIPTDLSLPGDAFYQLGVEIKPAAGFNSPELFTDDNDARDGNFHQVQNRFGSFESNDAGKRKDTVLTYTEPDGDVVKFSIKGPGSGKLIKGTNGIVDLELSETTAKTKVITKVISGSGDLTLRNIDALSVLGSAQLGRVDVTGNMAFASGIKKLVVDDATGPGSVSIGLFAGKEQQRVSLNFGRVSDLSVFSVMRISSLTAREWLDTGGISESITAPALGSLKITGGDGVRGDLQADLDITTTAKIKVISVAGLVTDAVLRVNGSVETVKLGGMIESSFLAGTDEKPSEVADFTESVTVQSFKIKGVEGIEDTFVNSVAAAETFRNISIRGVDGTSGSDTFGVIASTISKYSRDGGSKLSNLTVPGTIKDQVGNYQVEIV